MSDYNIYTQLIADEARRRGITVHGWPAISRDYIVLRYNDHRETIYQAVSNSCGAATHLVTFHKYVALALLKLEGFPIPATILTSDPAEAEAFLREQRKIVVKPIGRSGGVGVTGGVTTADELWRAIERAKEKSISTSGRFVCQQHIEGEDCRVLVVNFNQVFASKRVPAHVIGDGKHTVAELVETWNTSVLPIRRIAVDEAAQGLLANAGLRADSVPQKNERVFLSRLANSNRGAVIYDMTDVIAPSVARMARAIARHFNNPYLGVDFISPDITKEPGMVVELNPHAGIAIHHFPTVGQPRNVAGAILDMLFPELKTRS